MYDMKMAAGGGSTIGLPSSSLVGRSPKFMFRPSSSFQSHLASPPYERKLNSYSYSYSYWVCRTKRGRGMLRGLPFPVDPWAPSIDSQSIASQLFAFSLFPYIAFLYFITKSKTSPNLTLFGFYFLLAFVGATTKVQYGTSLSNVDWLHGGAESLLTLTNLFIVLGLRQALRSASKSNSQQNTPDFKDNKSRFEDL
ncbi:uncharacterized protein LOC107630726 isoform X2 [Arachis ipaensis]|uniref:uncharacterized protein LOC107630726 isoform X2 n=1 Tax=Arachis ipaensis TaxID=130454 RepID=UPI0007AFCF7B|nr:uncharacterized protein LOC107630726 isoform X2 [Arachis ipaensis]XP_025636957.1 uncharacterized protein LOC112732450 isoform X2 [Arachis hypogaea]